MHPVDWLILLLPSLAVGYIAWRTQQYTKAIWTRSDMVEIEMSILTIMARCHDQNVAETPNEKACLRCGRKANCKAMHATNTMAAPTHQASAPRQNTLKCELLRVCTACNRLPAQPR
jgi:hypothetical protein